MAPACQSWEDLCASFVASLTLGNSVRLWVMRHDSSFYMALKRVTASNGIGCLRHWMPCGLILALVDTLMLHEYPF